MKKLTIIIPCYNCEETIARCLTSVLEQGYANIEVLAINDGSTDGTKEALNRIASQDSRVKIVDIPNGGPSRARNLGLGLALGEYIAFVDSDDWVHQDIYVKLMDSIQACDADIAICNYANVYADLREESCRHALGSSNFIKEDVCRKVLRQYYGGDPTGLASLWNKIYRKATIDRLALRFDEQLYRAEDWWFNLSLYEANVKIATIEDELYYYWQGGQNNLMKRMELRLYYEWKNARQHLIQINEMYQFDYDPHAYYSELLCNIHSLLIVADCDRQEIKTILTDDFYKSIVKYDKKTTFLIRCIHVMGRISKSLELTFYKILRRLYRKKH